MEAPAEQLVVMACGMPFLTAPFLARLHALEGLDVREPGPDELARFDPGGRLLLNVNTPEDFARATA